jgi:hypothetical protein
MGNPSSSSTKAPSERTSGGDIDDLVRFAGPIYFIRSVTLCVPHSGVPSGLVQKIGSNWARFSSMQMDGTHARCIRVPAAGVSVSRWNVRGGVNSLMAEVSKTIYGCTCWLGQKPSFTSGVGGRFDRPGARVFQRQRSFPVGLSRAQLMRYRYLADS